MAAGPESRAYQRARYKMYVRVARCVDCTAHHDGLHVRCERCRAKRAAARVRRDRERKGA